MSSQCSSWDLPASASQLCMFLFAWCFAVVVVGHAVWVCQSFWWTEGDRTAHMYILVWWGVSSGPSEWESFGVIFLMLRSWGISHEHQISGSPRQVDYPWHPGVTFSFPGECVIHCIDFTDPSPLPPCPLPQGLARCGFRDPCSATVSNYQYVSWLILESSRWHPLNVYCSAS